MNTTTSVNFLDLFIILGLFQGLILGFFLIKKSSKENRANLFQGLFMLFVAFVIGEIILIDTGYVVKALFLFGITGPLNFILAPLIYLHTRCYIGKTTGLKTWYHFIPAFLWLIYVGFLLVQPAEFKYNLYVLSTHPDWPLLENYTGRPHDPIGVRWLVNYLTLIQVFIYLAITAYIISKKLKSLKQSFFRVENKVLLVLRNSTLHYTIVVIIYFISVFYFGMNSKVGGYFISTYISLMFFIFSYRILNESNYFSYPNSFMDFSPGKYERSSLNDSDKDRIREKLIQAMEKEMYHKEKLASLTNLSQKIKENKHHVSQVLNESFEKSFFEFIAHYRIEEAKRLLLDETGKKMTIEEIAELVGYNSKSSFNSSFKKYTGQTPSVFRTQNT